MKKETRAAASAAGRDICFELESEFDLFVTRLLRTMEGQVHEQESLEMVRVEK